MGITTYTDEVAATICERLALGESLRRICAEGSLDGDKNSMPSKTTVFRWLEANESFRDQYARAREWQAETILDDILEIADETSHDSQEIEIAPGLKVTQVNHEVVQRSKIRVDSRFKLMGQLHPKKYGPKMALTGADGGPLQVETTDARAALLSRLAGDQE